MATKAEIDQWIASQGGPEAVAHSFEDVELPDPRGMRNLPDGSENPDYDRAFKDKKISTRREIWTNKTTGATYAATRTPFANDQFEDIKQGSSTRAAGGTTKPTNVYVGTNPTTGKPSQISEYPDPSQPGGVRREYDDTQVPAAAAGEAKPPPTEDRGGRRLVWQPNPGGPNAGGKWVDVGAAPETPAERQAREANAPTQTQRTEEVNGQTYTVITIVPKPGQPGSPGQIVLGPNGQPLPTGIPGKNPTEEKKTVKGPDGRTYIQVTTQKPDGSVDLYHTDQQGARVPLPNAAPDNPTAPAPRMPNFVLGGSQAALTEYKAQLQQGVASGLWSQKWADDRWGEAVQTAQQVNQDYATQQREIESTRNAEINLAQGRATLGQNAISTALDHVNKINGSLPEGSPLGGQTFAALLGMNMLMQARSGIDSIDVRARPQQQVPAITPAEMRDPAAMQARRSEVSSQITASLGAPPFVQQPAAPVQPAQPTPSAATPAAPVGAASAGPARPAAPMLPEAVPGGGPPSPTGAPGFGAPAELPEATPGGGPPPPPPMPAQSTPMSQPETFAPGQFSGGSVLPQTPPEQPYVPVHEWQPAQPFNDDPTQGPVGQAPSRFAVLNAYGPQQQAPVQPAAVSNPPALLRSRAQTTPPWRLSAQEIQEMEAAGIDEATIWGVPGRVA